MSHIQQALGGLWEALENLSQATDEQEQKVLKLQQQELFNSHAAKRESGHQIDIDPAIISQRLDLAIAKIEQVLQEG